MKEREFLVITMYNDKENIDIIPVEKKELLFGRSIKIILNKTGVDIEKIKEKGEFVLCISDDYFPLTTKNYKGNLKYYTIEDLKKGKFTVRKAKYINAPIINELSICFECKLKEIYENENEYIVIVKALRRSANI